MINPWRLATMAIGFFGLFLVLVIRLWFLQVAAGEEFREDATSNQVRITYQQPPRGEIFDINGNLLAGSRPSQSLLMQRAISAGRLSCMPFQTMRAPSYSG